jgi:glyoxylase-like metal-dependent hydrolase (beta-lactamase superfamily II)
MANIELADPANVPGDFFVDRNCISCPTCRQVAPTVFGDGPRQPVVVNQPESNAEQLQALIALVACPAGSIGTCTRRDLTPAIDALPQPIEDEVFYCGFASPNSYGAHSYFIKREGGNILIDSPRFTQPLVRKLAAMGGVKLMFLTHKDDVADHEQFHKHFGCERVIHEADAHGGLKDVERKLASDGPWALAQDLKIIATPGHTRGSTALLYRDHFLFTGDHLSWRLDSDGLFTSRQYCQYSWDVQRQSVEKLLGETFTWILPGHGYRFHAEPEMMRREVRAAVARMGR